MPVFGIKIFYDVGKLSARELLCVSKKATHNEIRRNYMKLARDTHPDKNNGGSAKLFKLITKAKNELFGHSSKNDSDQRHSHSSKSDSDQHHGYSSAGDNKRHGHSSGDNSDQRQEHSSKDDSDDDTGDDNLLSARELLCLPKNATSKEIHSNYMKLARDTHPDKNNGGSAKLYKLITKAKDQLLGPSGDDSRARSNILFLLNNDEQMEMVLEPFSDVLNKYAEIIQLLQSHAQNATQIAVGHGIAKLNELFGFADNFGLEQIMKAYKKALESKFTCQKCKKQMQLNNICYCVEALNKCHCNVRKCCGTKPKE